jgi:hypothetical protein
MLIVGIVNTSVHRIINKVAVAMISAEQHELPAVAKELCRKFPNQRTPFPIHF